MRCEAQREVRGFARTVWGSFSLWKKNSCLYPLGSSLKVVVPKGGGMSKRPRVLGLSSVAWKLLGRYRTSTWVSWDVHVWDLFQQDLHDGKSVRGMLSTDFADESAAEIADRRTYCRPLQFLSEAFAPDRRQMPKIQKVSVCVCVCVCVCAESETGRLREKKERENKERETRRDARFVRGRKRFSFTRNQCQRCAEFWACTIGHSNVLKLHGIYSNEEMAQQIPAVRFYSLYFDCALGGKKAETQIEHRSHSGSKPPGFPVLSFLLCGTPAVVEARVSFLDNNITVETQQLFHRKHEHHQTSMFFTVALSDTGVW